MAISDAALRHLRHVADLPDLTGTRYELVEPLGRGGMGAVYRVRDTALDREVAMKVLAGAALDESRARLEQEARILARLEFPEFKHLIKLYLYDDVEELQRITGVAGAGGFSVPLAMHLPYDNDQTRLHEMVHVVAEKLPEKGGESRSLFFAEGLANAVLEFVTGVHVDAVAAFYKKTGKLLWETTLPFGGNATPAMYEMKGKQYIVVPAGGGRGKPTGGAYVAFALP